MSVTDRFNEPAYKAEMSFRYSNYDPDTNTFRVKCSICDDYQVPPEIWNSFYPEIKRSYERTDHSAKEKWLIRQIEALGETYLEMDHDKTERWIDYNEDLVKTRFFNTTTNSETIETLDLSELEEEYYDRLEGKLVEEFTTFKQDLIYYIDQYIERSIEDFIEQYQDDEKEYKTEEDNEFYIVSRSELMKGFFTKWLQEKNKEYSLY